MIAVDTSRIDELGRALAAAPGERAAAEGRLEKAKTDHEAARLTFQATRARAELGHLPQSAVTQAERSLKSARAELDAAEDALAIAAEKSRVLARALDDERKKSRDGAAPQFRAEGARIAREVQAHLDALATIADEARELESQLNAHMGTGNTRTGGRLFDGGVEPVAAVLAALRGHELKGLFRRWSNVPAREELLK
jgi:chromosome segregation ATPase